MSTNEKVESGAPSDWNSGECLKPVSQHKFFFFYLSSLDFVVIFIMIVPETVQLMCYHTARSETCRSQRSQRAPVRPSATIDLSVSRCQLTSRPERKSPIMRRLKGQEAKGTLTLQGREKLVHLLCRLLSQFQSAVRSAVAEETQRRGRSKV